MRLCTAVCLAALVFGTDCSTMYAQTLQTLATFNVTNGFDPRSGLVMDPTGNLYGTTFNGGAFGAGTIFQIDAATHSLTTIFSFTGANGSEPDASVTLDGMGNLYGTTRSGGVGGYGTVFGLNLGSHAITTTEMVGTANTAAVGDVNGDGKSDLVVSNLSGTGSVSVMLGNGDGTFQAQVPYDTGSQTRDVKLADMNGDGKLDLVAVNQYGNSVSILLGNGDGTFQGQQTLAAGTRPWYAAVADLNGDGKADIVVADYGGTAVSVLMGQ